MQMIPGTYTPDVSGGTVQPVDRNSQGGRSSDGKRLRLPFAWMSWVVDRFKARPDSEHEQAIIRVVIGILVLGYLFSLPVRRDIPPSNFPVDPRTAILLFVLFSAFVFVDILLRPNANPVRRILGTVGDLGATSYIMSISGESGLPLTVVYLWVIMGNGFRYGPRYLYGAIGIGVVGLTLVYATDVFWKTHPILFWSQLIAITVLPLYMVVLLKKLQKLIEQANEASLAKSRFLANMSHELRTPLNGIIGMSDLLFATGPKAEQKNLLTTIRSSAHALLEIVQSILDFSKIEAGKLLVEKVDFDFHAFLRETMAILEPLAQKKNLGFAVWIDPSVPYAVNGDPRHVRQILINIVGNAIKFTEEGRVDVRVSKVSDPDGTVRIRFDVRDTGIGIPENVRSRIFDSFAQADESVTRRFGGTGLGMTIAKQLVDLLGGTISFRSRVNQGTVFRFEIPFERQESQDFLPINVPKFKVLVDATTALSGRIVPLLRDIGIEPVCVHREVDTANFPDLESSGPFDVVIMEVLPSHCIPNRIDDESEEFGIHAVRILIDSLNLGKETLAQRFSAGFFIVFESPLDSRSLSNALHLVRKPVEDSLSPVLPEPTAMAPVRNSGLFVLVADDHPVNQQVIKGILEFGGHTVHIVEDGEQALDLLESDFFRFDLMILDMHMPKIGGLDVLKAHRFMERDNPIPAIILTANATLQAMAECESAGADVYLTKPVDAKRLLSTVENLHVQKSGGMPERVQAESSEDYDGVIDLGMLKHLEELTNNPNFLKDLVERFTSDGHDLIREIEEVAFSGEVSRFQDAIHALKGSAAQIGGFRLVQLCMEAELQKVQELDPERSLALADRIRETFLVTSRQLSIHIQGRSPTRDGKRTISPLPGFNPGQNRVR